MNLWLALLLAQSVGGAVVGSQTLPLVDAVRTRPVPVRVYTPAPRPAPGARVVILSPGYGLSNQDYSFIANRLAADGYLVASVRHEVEGDAPLPTTGVPAEVRRPSWQRGVENIRFVIGELKTRYPDLDWGSVALIGHSHGGDTSMLFATEHPDLVSAVISLDNRRMKIPRTARPRIFSLRSSDQPADEGVVPTLEEQEALGMRIVTLKGTRHDDMWDGATEDQKAEMLRLIREFLAVAR